MIQQHFTVDIPKGHWSQSEDASFRRCRLQWYRSWVQRIRSRRSSWQLAMGTILHAARAEFHQTPVAERSLGVLQEAFFAQFRPYAETLEEDFRVDIQARCINALGAIWREFGRDEQIPPGHSELRFEVDLPGNEFQFVGHVDHFYIVKERYFILYELKHTFGTSRDIMQLELHETQTARYVWALEKSIGLPCKEVILEMVRVPVKPYRLGEVERVSTLPSKREIERAVGDLPLVMREAFRPDMFIYSSWREGCRFDCEYYALCLANKTGGDIQALLEEHYTSTDTPQVMEAINGDTDIE